MKLSLKRIAKKPNYTVGKLYIDGEYFCDTLEDQDRGLSVEMPLAEITKAKVMHKTAIPTGTYPVVVTNSPSKKRLLPRLQNVPAFDGILIHRGNTENDSSGCILLGENKEVGKVLNSTKYELELTELLKTKKDVTIEIC
jgi:hypothetical protein